MKKTEKILLLAITPILAAAMGWSYVTIELTTGVLIGFAIFLAVPAGLLAAMIAKSLFEFGKNLINWLRNKETKFDMPDFPYAWPVGAVAFIIGAIIMII